MGRPPGVVDFQQLRQPGYSDPLSGTERNVLLIIAERPGVASYEIGEASKLTPDAVSRATRKLYTLQMIRSRQDPTDRRIVRYGMTERGYEDLLGWASMRHGRRITGIQGVTIWDPEKDA